jgi:DNA-binding transcriptional ArsR family regulator
MPEADVFRTLADPTRRTVFERLCNREMSVSELKAGFAISQPAISQHLAALRGAGLVCERRQGRFAYYRAQPQGLVPLVDWMRRCRPFEPERLET